MMLLGCFLFLFFFKFLLFVFLSSALFNVRAITGQPWPWVVAGLPAVLLLGAVVKLVASCGGNCFCDSPRLHLGLLCWLHLTPLVKLFLMCCPFYHLTPSIRARSFKAPEDICSNAQHTHHALSTMHSFEKLPS